MAKKHTFLSEAVAALEKLGGQAHFSEIYNEILTRGNLDFSKAKTPEATLRRTLQLNRSEHPNSESNTFYSIYGVESRKGYWGLVKFLTEEIYTPEEIEKDLTVIEGAKKSILVNKFERDTKARITCIEHTGAVCVACGFDFGAIYGERFIGKIHVHHVIPISSIGKEYNLNPQMDLVPLCPNCHYVAHLKGKNEAYTVDEIKKMIKESKTIK